MENVSGWSGKDLTTSIKSFAGIAMFDLIDDSIEIFDVSDVSRSEDVINNSLFSISNKKQSRMGKVLLLFNIVPKTCKFFSKLSEEIINFILKNKYIVKDFYNEINFNKILGTYKLYRNTISICQSK